MWNKIVDGARKHMLISPEAFCPLEKRVLMCFFKKNKTNKNKTLKKEAENHVDLLPMLQRAICGNKTSSTCQVEKCNPFVGCYEAKSAVLCRSLSNSTHFYYIVNSLKYEDA